jgi:hypothetical protein
VVEHRDDRRPIRRPARDREGRQRERGCARASCADEAPVAAALRVVDAGPLGTVPRRPRRGQGASPLVRFLGFPPRPHVTTEEKN